MAARKKSDENTKAPSQHLDDSETIEERRARRLAAWRTIAGIWADRADIPADGVEYQRALRDAWRR